MRDREKVMSILQEECAEVIQAISKVYRFGLDNSWNGVTNKEALITEIGDVLAMIDILLTETNINIQVEEIYDAIERKKEKLKIFLPVESETQ
jgi:NTP pyrophosphatase (non-canonical NTP hydrolase)